MPTTEQTSLHYKDLDLWRDKEILDAIWKGQMRAVTALEAALPVIELAVLSSIDRLKNSKGRLAYVGAGTSGHLAMHDAMELIPTFGWPKERILFLMAGGDAARLFPRENTEDDTKTALSDAVKAGFCANDVVIAVSASGSTPYTLEIARQAKASGALLLGIMNNEGTPLATLSDHAIVLDTGPEVITGSTRMAAGTAQRGALVSFSTLLMTRLDFVVDGHMVNMMVENKKLRNRAMRMIRDLSGADEHVALDALDKAEGAIKLAVLVARGCALDQAKAVLAAKGNNLRQALADI